MRTLRRLFTRSATSTNLSLEFPAEFEADLSDMATRLKVSPSLLLRIVMKGFLQAITDRRTRDLLRQVLETHSSGRCVCEVYGDIGEVARVLNLATTHGDEHCLRTFALYAEQIVACYARDLKESEDAKLAQQTNNASRPKDIW